MKKVETDKKTKNWKTHLASWSRLSERSALDPYYNHIHVQT